MGVIGRTICVAGGVNREVFESRAEKRRHRGRDNSTRDEERRNSRKSKRGEKGTEAEWQMTPVRRPEPSEWADLEQAPMPAMPGTGKGKDRLFSIHHSNATECA